MQEICIKAEELANAILRGAGFSLQASASEVEQGCLVSIDGPDNGLLLNQGGELLDALQQILNQAVGRNLPKGQRIVCDADNYRAARESELRAMAHHAARQVRSTGSSFVFGPMDGNERRIIPLTLADELDLHTEQLAGGTPRPL